MVVNFVGIRQMNIKLAGITLKLHMPPRRCNKDLSRSGDIAIRRFLYVHCGKIIYILRKYIRKSQRHMLHNEYGRQI